MTRSPGARRPPAGRYCPRFRQDTGGSNTWRSTTRPSCPVLLAELYQPARSPPAPPALRPGPGPSEPPSSATADASENSAQSSATETNESNMRETKPTVTTRRSTSENDRVVRRSPNEDNYDRGPTNQGRGRARIIGRTPDGRPIVKLTSGRVVILPRRYDDNGIYPSRSRRRVYLAVLISIQVK